MAVTSCNIRREGWTGEASIAGAGKYSVQWLVQCDDLDDGPAIAMRGALYSTPDPIPAANATYAIGNDTDNTVVIHSFSTALHGYSTTGPIWIITGTYGEPDTHTSGGYIATNPFNRPVKYHVEWANYTKIITKDVNGNPLQNSAKQPFADPVEQEDQRPVLVGTYNVPTLAQVAALGMQYKNAVNTSSFWGAPPRCAKVQSITCSELMEDNGVQYYQITIRVEFNDEPWDREFVDQGMKYLKAGKLIKADDSEGVPTGEPVLLDALGNKLADDLPGRFVTFRTYPERDFSALGI